MMRWITLLAVLALAAVAPAPAAYAANQVGIYMVEDPDGCATSQVDAPSGTTFTCYVVLNDPRDEVTGRPITTVGGFELRLGLPTDVYLIASWQPPENTTEFNPPEYLVGAVLPVVDGRCTLMWLRFLTVTDEPRFVSLGPLQFAPPSIPGRMAYADYDDDFAVHGMDPVSGSPDVPVFAINWDGDLSFCETVPDEGIAFGAVKALYR